MTDSPPICYQCQREPVSCAAPPLGYACCLTYNVPHDEAPVATDDDDPED